MRNMRNEEMGRYDIVGSMAGAGNQLKTCMKPWKSNRQVGTALPGAAKTNVMFVTIVTCRQIARFSYVDIDAV